MRVLRPGRARWTRGHAVWVWAEPLVPVIDLRVRQPDRTERTKLHHLGDEPTVVRLCSANGQTVTVAAAAGHETALLGRFAQDHTTVDSAVPPVPPSRCATHERSRART